MAMRAWLAVVSGFIGMIPQGADAASVPVTELVSQLGSARFVEREAARQALDALGSAALEALRQAAASEDLEIRHRAEELIRHINQRLDNERFLAPQMIHLQLKDVTVAEAVAGLAARTGFRIETQGVQPVVSSRKITLDTGEVSFWEAYQQLCARAGLYEKLPAGPSSNTGKSAVPTAGRVVISESNYAPAKTDNRLTLTDTVTDQLPTCNVGSIRFRVLPPAAGATNRPGGEVEFMLDITPEPSMQFEGVVEARIDRAADDTGHLLQSLPTPTLATIAGSQQVWANGGMIVVNDGSLPYVAGQRGQVPVRLQLGERPARRLTELKGIATVRVQKTEALVTIEKVLQAAGQNATGDDGTTIKITDAARRGSNTALRLLIQSAQANGLGGGQLVRVNNGNQMIFIRSSTPFVSATGRLALLDDSGKSMRIFTRTQRGLNANPNGGLDEDIELIFETPANGGDLKLVLTGPRSRSFDVPFTLTNIPLP